MARGLWRLARDFKPINWAVLAGERDGRPKKGDKRSREVVERNVATWRANRAARQKAATERRARELRDARKARLAKGITAKMLLAMQPGHWYGRPDIRDLSGVKRNSVHALLARMERRGWIERGVNPDHVPVEYVKGLGIDWQARGRSPAVLFRLTPAGEAERKLFEYLE